MTEEGKNLQEPNNNNKMSTYKIMSIISLVCSIAVFLWGGFVIPALVLSIVVLATRSPMEKEAKLLAKVALAISIVYIVYVIVIFCITLGLMANIMNTPADFGGANNNW